MSAFSICMTVPLSNYCFIKPCMFWSERFVNKRFDKWDSRSRCQILEQKDWESSLEIKSNFSVSSIFKFPLKGTLMQIWNTANIFVSVWQ